MRNASIHIEIGEVRALKQNIYHILLMIMNYVIIPTVRVNGTKQKKKLETIIINSYTYIYKFIIL